MEKNKLIDSIVDIELEMFLNVPTSDDPECRETPGAFRTHRAAQFSAWSERTLQSYLEDLKFADETGRNLLTYKYARMDDLIPSENTSHFVDEIAEIEIEWQKEFIAEYPKLMANARGLTDSDKSSLDVSFERYLKAELESYSQKTLSLLKDDVMSYKKEGINMSEKIYEELVKNYGFNSLEKFK